MTELIQNEEVISAEKRARKTRNFSFQSTPEVAQILEDIATNKDDPNNKWTISSFTNSAIVHFRDWLKLGEPETPQEEIAAIKRLLDTRLTRIGEIKERLTALEERVDSHKEGFEDHEVRIAALEGAE